MSDWFSSTPPSSSSSSNNGDGQDINGDKLPPIKSPIVKYDEWTRRGQSLNRRTSVDYLRNVNPIRWWKRCCKRCLLVANILCPRCCMLWVILIHAVLLVTIECWSQGLWVKKWSRKNLFCISVGNRFFSRLFCTSHLLLPCQADFNHRLQLKSCIWSFFTFGQSCMYQKRVLLLTQNNVSVTQQKPTFSCSNCFLVCFCSSLPLFLCNLLGSVISRSYRPVTSLNELINN